MGDHDLGSKLVSSRSTCDLQVCDRTRKVDSPRRRRWRTKLPQVILSSRINIRIVTTPTTVMAFQDKEKEGEEGASGRCCPKNARASQDLALAAKIRI
jgi:hypothetical protein